MGSVQLLLEDKVEVLRLLLKTATALNMRYIHMISDSACSEQVGNVVGAMADICTGLGEMAACKSPSRRCNRTRLLSRRILQQSSNPLEEQLLMYSYKFWH